jgi:hypothetical protein
MPVKLRLTAEELAKAHDGLCGVSIGDGPCSCLVHWIEALQTEADKLKLEKRGFQIMSRRVMEAASLGFIKSAMDEGNYARAGGDVECQFCRQPYVEHPELPKFPTFHLLCSGAVVKT